MPRLYKLIVHVPSSHADAVRMAIGDAGGGKCGNYSHCSFTTSGVGRYKANDIATPHIGAAGEHNETQEECIEVSHISEDILTDVVAAMESIHPYEETAYQVFEMVNVKNLKEKS